MGVGGVQGSQSYLFTLSMILTMFDVPRQQGTSKSMEALQDGADAFLVTTSAPLSHRGRPNAFLVPSHTHSPGPTVSASGDGLCHFQTQHRSPQPSRKPECLRHEGTFMFSRDAWGRDGNCRFRNGETEARNGSATYGLLMGPLKL